MEKQKEVLRVLLKNYTKISRNGGISKVIFDDKFEDISEEIVKLFAIPVVVKSLPHDNFCIVCNLPTDGIKCYSKRCPI